MQVVNVHIFHVQYEIIAFPEFYRLIRGVKKHGKFDFVYY